MFLILVLVFIIIAPLRVHARYLSCAIVNIAVDSSGGAVLAGRNAHPELQNQGRAKGDHRAAARLGIDIEVL